MEDFANPENYEGSNLLTIKKIAENIKLQSTKTEDFARPENYEGSNLLTIKKIAENIKLQGTKTKHYHTSVPPHHRNDFGNKEERHLTRSSNREHFQVNGKHQNEMRSKKLDYQKLLLTNKSFKRKKPSLLKQEDFKLNEEKIITSEIINKSQITVPTPHVLFGMTLSRKTEMAIKSKAIDLFKWAIKMIRAWVRYLNCLSEISHRKQQKYLFMIQSFYEAVESIGIQIRDLSFNKHHFKASKDIELTPEMQKVLSLNPKQRTEEQIFMIMHGLSALSALNEYPLHLRKMLCTVAYFRKIDSRRVIIRQGHIAEYFYFILSGKAIVTITSNDDFVHARTVNSLSKGCSFGELALLHRSRRTASVVSISAMQLLAIERNDFFYIFLNTLPDCSKYPEHVSFIKEIPILYHLNLDQLVAQAEGCLCHFYKNSVLICANDIESQWVYIVKSGSCSVFKELRVPAESKLIKEKTLTLNDIKDGMDTMGDYQFCPISLNDMMGNIKSKTSTRWKTTNDLKSGDYFYFQNKTDVNSVSGGNIDDGKNYISVFIKITDLLPKDIYGLSSVIFSTEDKVRIENMASVALLSNKAEMVLISKRFFVQKSNENLIKDIRLKMRQYPSEKVFMENYQTRISWEKYKIQRYKSTLKKID